MAVVEHPAKSTVAAVAGKTGAHASALAAVAQSVQANGKHPATPTPSKLKKVEEALAAAAEAPVKKEPEIDIEEVRFWMRQTVVYVALLACVVAMGSAHWAGKSFLSMAMCGATAAILTGLAGTVVAQLSLGQVVVQDEPAQPGHQAGQAAQANPPANP